MRITIESSGPDPSRIPPEEFIGVTAILVTWSYNDNEFFRVGYYVNVLYADEEMNENPPNPPLIDQLGRIIMVDQPRVTNFPIEWDNIGSTLGVVPPEQLENYNPMSGFGYSGDGKQSMYAQDRKEMFSEQNVMLAAETLKSPFSNVTNQ